MSRAKPAGAEKGPSRLWLGMRRILRFADGFLDLLDLLVVAGIALVVVGAFLIGLWRSPTARPWLIGVLVAAPVFLALRRRD